LESYGYIDSHGILLLDEIPELILPERLAHLRDGIIGAIEKAKRKQLKGRLFLSLSNERGMQELLTLWQKWERGQGLPRGKMKWRDVLIR